MLLQYNKCCYSYFFSFGMPPKASEIEPVTLGMPPEALGAYPESNLSIVF